MSTCSDRKNGIRTTLVRANNLYDLSKGPVPSWLSKISELFKSNFCIFLHSSRTDCCDSQYNYFRHNNIHSLTWKTKVTVKILLLHNSLFHASLIFLLEHSFKKKMSNRVCAWKPRFDSLNMIPNIFLRNHASLDRCIQLNLDMENCLIMEQYKNFHTNIHSHFLIECWHR